MANELLLRYGDKVLFQGDSITDAGRRDEAWQPWGRGYVYMAATSLYASYPQLELQVENRGIGGNTVLDLRARWQQDAVQEAPTVLSLLIGINDVIRVVRRGPNHDNLTLEQYEANYMELLQDLRRDGPCRFILWEPFLATLDHGTRPVATLEGYCQAVNRIAGRFDDCLVIHTQKIFDEACKRRSPEYWASDSVHPTPWGHALMAQAFLRAIGAEPSPQPAA